MNDGVAVCDVCGGPAAVRGWLRCMLCGGRFHLAPEGDALEPRDCGIIAPNPQSKDGC